jgi:hypothetical protein
VYEYVYEYEYGKNSGEKGPHLLLRAFAPSHLFPLLPPCSYTRISSC